MDIFKKKWTKLTFLCNAINILAVLLLYPIIRYLLEYTQNSIYSVFQTDICNLVYTQRYLLIAIIYIIIQNCILMAAYKKTAKTLAKKNNEGNSEESYVDMPKTIKKAQVNIYITQVITTIIAIITMLFMFINDILLILNWSIVFTVLILLVAIVSYVFSKFLFMHMLVEILNKTNKYKDFELVTRKMSKTTEAREINSKIPLSSKNDINDLIKSFILVQEKTTKYIEQIEQEFQQQEQFVVLGEFAGGLAHDLNSPLSAVKLDVSALNKYINSDKVLTNEETTEKLNNIINNIDSSLNHMESIVMGVRNQIRKIGDDSDKEEFLLKDLLEKMKILFRSILVKNNCHLEINIPDDLYVYGEKNKLDRVIWNIITNSIDAYVSINKKGDILVKAHKENCKIIIAISDEAGGIDKDVKDSIIKEIKSTKAENGTGFGLYYSNTIIENSFEGKMYFETNNIGTTLYIEIPDKRKE